MVGITPAARNTEMNRTRRLPGEQDKETYGDPYHAPATVPDAATHVGSLTWRSAGREGSHLNDLPLPCSCRYVGSGERVHNL